MIAKIIRRFARFAEDVARKTEKFAKWIDNILKPQQ